MAKNLLNELPVNFPKKELKSLFDSYPSLNLDKPSSYILWSEALIKAHILEVCHASMRHEKPNWDNLITAVPKTDELSLEYLRMLIRGPFRSMSDLIKLERLKDDYYIHCMSLDKWPANVLFNFCIATRVPIEFDYLLKPWAKRCEAGFDSTLAFLLTYSYGDQKDTKTRFGHMPRSGHMWLDPASSWENVLCGEMVGISEPFKTHPNKCTPTNSIWGRSNDYIKLTKLSDEQIADFYSVPIRAIEPPPLAPKKLKKINFANYALQQFHAEQALQAQPPEPALGAAWAEADIVEAQPPAGPPVWAFDANGNIVEVPNQANNIIPAVNMIHANNAVHQPAVNFPADDDANIFPDDDDDDDFDDIDEDFANEDD